MDWIRLAPPLLATQRPENRAACEADESRVRVFRDQATNTLPLLILTRRATGCDIFLAARTRHVLNLSWLASLADLTRAEGRTGGLGLVGWSSKCVSLNQVPVI